MTYYEVEEMKNSGMEINVVFYADPNNSIHPNGVQNHQMQQEIQNLKTKEQNVNSYICFNDLQMIKYINEIENEKARLEDEIKALAGI